MEIRRGATTGPLKTGKLPALPPKKAAAKPAAPTKAEQQARSKAVARLRDAVDARDAALPWRNNADLNAKLTTKLRAKIEAANTKSGAVVNNIIRAEIAKHRGKLSYWDYDFSINAQGKLSLKLNFKGKMDAFDSSGVTLRQSVDAYIKKGGDPELAFQVLKQIDKPNARIKQISKFTCVPANVQRDIAKMNPQKYFVLTTSLALRGKAELPNGKVLEVSKENKNWIESSKMSPNSRINAYFQAALMDMADGAAKYNAKLGKSTGSNGLSMEALGIEQARSLWKSVGGTPAFDPVAYRALMKAQKKPVNPSAMLHEVERLYKGAKDERRVMVPLKSEGKDKHMFHQVTVLRMADGKVRYYDPGKETEVTVSRDKFLQMMGTNMQKGDRIGNSTTMAATTTTTTTTATAAPTRRR